MNSTKLNETIEADLEKHDERIGLVVFFCLFK